jgi:amino acid adenylation domain-containing protein
VPEPVLAFSSEDTRQPIAARFGHVVRQVPNRTAIQDGERSYSYTEADELSDRIASGLRRRGLGTGDVVALLLPHGAAALVGLLGVTKSGATYAPLDTAWPEEHLDDLLADADARAVLTDQAGISVLSRLLRWKGSALALDNALAEGATPFDCESSEEAAACIYYSSGSTGRPKGIVLSHRSVLTEAYNYARAVGITHEDRLVWLSPLAFGASKLPIFGACASGACVLPFSVPRRGVRALSEWLGCERVTLLSCVPSLFRELAEELPEGAGLPFLRAVKLGGEPVLRSDADLFRRRLHRGCSLVNGLGISEAAGNVCFYAWNSGTLPEGPTVPLGYPVEDVDIEVLDDAGRSMAAGQVGEIAVRAPHLALGYWRRPDLTREKFVEERGGARRFLTGDIGRMTADGCLIGLGRKDDIPKIRGHRVDPAEVDAALLGLGELSQVVTIARDFPAGPKLVSFFVPAGASEPSPAELRQKLRRRLPEFMIPSRFAPLASLPTLSNGKVDRRALAAMDLPRGRTRGRAESHDALELQLRHIWSKVLRTEDVGFTDDFFELGGDSLDAVRLFALLERRLRVNLPLTELIAHSTIESLARAVREGAEHRADSSAILLNAGDGRVVFFCVPGAGSDAFDLLELARCLGPEPTFYALQHPGIDGTRPRFMSVEEMAERFLKDVRSIQPDGPYYLGGTSFGGMVAYEMARRLSAGGAQVALLALLDTFGPHYPALRAEALVRHLPTLAIRWLLPVGRKEETTLANLRRGVRERWYRWRAVLDLALPLRRSAPPYELRFIYLQEICFRAHRRYSFPAYDHPIVLFRVEQQPPASLYVAREDLGWRPVARGGLEIVEIPGYHGSHIRQPHVQTLAAKLGAKLLEAAVRPQGSFEAIVSRTRDIWNELGPWWDERIGEDGNPESRDLLLPAVDRLLAAKPGERILDVGCGNGWYARRLARAGARVVGFDFSEVLIDRARARTEALGLDISFQVIDATRDSLTDLGERSFDAAICLMTLMDMADVEPLFGGLSRVLKPGGRLVFSIIHPDRGRLADASPLEPLIQIGIAGQPVAHYYFHRPLPMLLDLAEQSGFELDAQEEPGSASADQVGERAPMQFFVGRLRLTSGPRSRIREPDPANRAAERLR